MDGFTGFKTATSHELPEATAVLDPSTSSARRRRWTAAASGPWNLHGHRGRSTDPLCARRTLHTGADLLTDRQQQRLTALFGDEDHIQVQATWSIYQRMIAAYRHPNRAAADTP